MSHMSLFPPLCFKDTRSGYKILGWQCFSVKMLVCRRSSLYDVFKILILLLALSVSVIVYFAVVLFRLRVWGL